MKEKDLRLLHRRMGAIVAIFILLQALTGLVLSFENLLGAYWGGIVHDIHYRYGTAGNVYRIILGIALTVMAVSGMSIYLKIRARTKKAGSQS